MKNNVKVLKLITGEEVISELTQNQDGTLLLETPLVVMPAPPDESGRISLSLIPWSISGKTEKVVLEAKNVLVILEATDAMTINYNSAISFEESLVSAQPPKMPTNIINE
jgi:hypothetical protein